MVLCRIFHLNTFCSLSAPNPTFLPPQLPQFLIPPLCRIFPDLPFSVPATPALPCEITPNIGKRDSDGNMKTRLAGIENGLKSHKGRKENLTQRRRRHKEFSDRIYRMDRIGFPEAVLPAIRGFQGVSAGVSWGRKPQIQIRPRNRAK